MMFAYFQGGPKDLHKEALTSAQAPSRIVVAVALPNPLLEGSQGLSRADKDRAIEVEKHVYNVIGGYVSLGNEIVTYAWGGPTSQVIA